MDKGLAAALSFIARDEIHSFGEYEVMSKEGGNVFMVTCAVINQQDETPIGYSIIQVRQLMHQAGIIKGTRIYAKTPERRHFNLVYQGKREV